VGAALVGVGAWRLGDVAYLAELWTRASQWLNSVPTMAWLLLPLVITAVLAGLARVGVLQRWFGDLYKDLTDTDVPAGMRLTMRDDTRLRALLARWNAPMPYLSRADNWMVRWAGQEPWSLAGFDRCWLVALIYPLVALLLTWAIINSGRLGDAVILLPTDTLWQRCAGLLGIVAACVVTFSIVRLSTRINVFRQVLSRLGRMGHVLSRLSDDQLVVLMAMTLYALVAQIFFSDDFFGFKASPHSGSIGGFIENIFGNLLGGANAGYFSAVFVAVSAGAGSIVDIKSTTRICSISVQTVALVVIGGFVYSGAGIFAGLLAVVVLAIVIFMESLLRVMLARKKLPAWCGSLCLSILYATLFAAAVYIFPRWASQDFLHADRIAFVAIIFFGVLPLLNGLADWVSLNATRVFIAKMQAGASRGRVARLYVLDIAVAVALTMVVYGGTIALVWGMQWAGWPIDLVALLLDLRDHPWSSQNNWLMLLAVTNFVPTLIHLVLWLSDGAEFRDVESRELIEQFLRDGGASAPRQIAPTIIYLLKLKPWLEKAMVLSLTLALVPLFAICIPWGAGLVLMSL